MITVDHLVGIAIGLFIGIILSSLAGMVNAKRMNQGVYDQKQLIRTIAEKVKKELRG